MNWFRSNRFYDVLNALLTFFVLLLASLLVFVRVYAEERVEQSVDIHNVPPVVETAIASTEPGGTDVQYVFLTTGKSTDLFVWGRVMDQNGCEDLSHVRVKVFRKDLGQSCSPRDGLCIETDNIPIEGCVVGFNSATYVASVPIPYYADPTDTGSPSEGTHWAAAVTVQDRSGATDTKLSMDFDIASIVAMDAGDILDFGTMIPGGTSDATPLQLENQGNRPFDFSVYSMGNLSCAGGSSSLLPSEDLHVSLLHETTFAQSEALMPPLKPTNTTNELGANALQGLLNYFSPQTQDVANPNLVSRDTLAIPQTVLLPANVETHLTGSGIRPVYFFLRVPETLSASACIGSLGITAAPRY